MLKCPLVQKEWRSVRWIMLLFLGFLTFIAINLNNNIYDEKTYRLMRETTRTIFMDEVYRLASFMIPALLLGIAILVIALFLHERNLYVGKFISSLPFTRKKQFTVKYIMGLLTYTIPFILFGVVVSNIYIDNKTWIDNIYKYLPYGGTLSEQENMATLLMWFVTVWLIITAVYSFLMMVQTLMGQNIIAGAVGGIVLFVPWFLIFAVSENLSLLTGKRFSYPSWLSDSIRFFLFSIPQNSFEVIDIPHLGDKSRWYGVEFYIINDYSYLALYILILVAVIMISTLLAYKFIQHNDVEKNGDIVMYPWVGKLLIVGVTLCSVLLLPIIILVFTGVESRMIALLAMIMGGILGYIISVKSIELTRRHG